MKCEMKIQGDQNEKSAFTSDFEVKMVTFHVLEINKGKIYMPALPFPLIK